MSAALMGVVAVIYVGVAISFWRDNDPGMSLAFAAYAVSNLGLIWKTL